MVWLPDRYHANFETPSNDCYASRYNHLKSQKVQLLSDVGRFQEAMADFELIREGGSLAEAARNRAGITLERMGKVAEAMEYYNDSVRNNALCYSAHARLAWLQATSIDVNIRNGKLAIEHAAKAGEICGWRDVNCLMIAAAAHAEDKDYDSAIDYQKRALALAAEETERRSQMRMQRIEGVLRKAEVVAADSKAADVGDEIEALTEECDRTKWNRSAAIESLAMAYARSGDHKSAIAFGEKCNALLKSHADESILLLRIGLDLYNLKQPFREYESVSLSIELPEMVLD